jgi:hypothetical protein
MKSLLLFREESFLVHAEWARKRALRAAALFRANTNAVSAYAEPC